MFYLNLKLKTFVLGMVALVIAGCGGKKNEETFACTASGNTSSSGLNSTSLQVSNLTVNMVNAAGPFTITIPGIAPFTTRSSNYSYPGSVFLNSSQTISVIDTASNQTTTCQVSSDYSLNSGGNNYGNTIQISASPSTSAAVGSTITLSAYDSQTQGSGLFQFSLNSQASGVTLQKLSSSQATITSTVATSVTVTVTEYSGLTYSNAVLGTSQITVYFGSGGSSGSGGTATGTLSCQLYHSGNGTYYRNSKATFQIVASNGESLQITHISPGEDWTSKYPLVTTTPSTFNLYYTYAGTKYLAVTANSISRPGYTCTATDTITIY